MANHIDFEWRGPLKFAFDSETAKISSPKGDTEDLEWASERIVYVLKFMAPHYVKYRLAKSAVCYVGHGSNIRRVAAHRGTWLRKIALVLEDFKGFELWVCQPRVRNNELIRKEVERDALKQFETTFGEFPLFNQIGAEWSDRTYSRSVRERTREIFELPANGFSQEIRSLGARG